MPSDHTKILEFNQYQISDEPTFAIYADLECLWEEIGGCKIILKFFLQQK